MFTDSTGQKFRCGIARMARLCSMMSGQAWRLGWSHLQTGLPPVWCLMLTVGWGHNSSPCWPMWTPHVGRFGLPHSIVAWFKQRLPPKGVNQAEVESFYEFCLRSDIAPFLPYSIGWNSHKPKFKRREHSSMKTLGGKNLLFFFYLKLVKFSTFIYFFNSIRFRVLFKNIKHESIDQLLFH